jgi:hypothetical protein
VIALWNDRLDGLREIELAPKAGAVLLSAAIESSTRWTADGRCHDVPTLRLDEVRQVSARRSTRRGDSAVAQTVSG